MRLRSLNIAKQRSLATPEPWNWEFGAGGEWDTKRMYSVNHVVFSFQQEVCEGVNRAEENRGRGSCWFTGAVWGFPHPSALQLREQILRRTHRRRRVVYVNCNLLTYHNKLLDLEIWLRRLPNCRESGLQQKKKKIRASKTKRNIKTKGHHSCKLLKLSAKWWVQR